MWYIEIKVLEDLVAKQLINLKLDSFGPKDIPILLIKFVGLLGIIGNLDTKFVIDSLVLQLAMDLV